MEVPVREIQRRCPIVGKNRGTDMPHCLHLERWDGDEAVQSTEIDHRSDLAVLPWHEEDVGVGSQGFLRSHDRILCEKGSDLLCE